jgi:hypothetical protein
MGKACVRFKKLDDLALDVIGEAIRRIPAKKYIAYVEAVRPATGKPKTSTIGKEKASATAPKGAKAKTSARKK